MKLLRPAFLPLMLLGWGISKAARRSGFLCWAWFGHAPERRGYGFGMRGHICERCGSACDCFGEASLGRARRSG
jgi:hypothetical protein